MHTTTLTAAEYAALAFPDDRYTGPYGCYMVAPSGEVRAYDEVARHYSSCHSLSEPQQARIRAQAANVAGGQTPHLAAVAELQGEASREIVPVDYWHTPGD